MTTKTSRRSPAKLDNSAIPSASAPADRVPKARFNPLLRVAPEGFLEDYYCLEKS